MDTEIVHIGNRVIRSCIDCKKCSEIKKCVFNDPVNEMASSFAECYGMVIGSPVCVPSGNAITAQRCRIFRSAWGK